jgi:hypothetical protein
MAARITLQGITPVGRQSYRWPESIEEFDHGWEATVVADGVHSQLRHLVGGRDVYGRHRVHTVTFLDGQPLVEGVAADDFDQTQALISRLRLAGSNRQILSVRDVPDAYNGFHVVVHDHEICAPYSPRALALKIPVDDLDAWAKHAIARRSGKRLKPMQPPGPEPPPLPPLPKRPGAVIVGCVSTKQDRKAAARDLYTSALFVGRRARAESAGAPWFILSALHGLVAPATVIAPYDVSMEALSASERAALGERAVSALEEAIGPLDGQTIELHAGDSYARALASALDARGARLVRPLKGFTLGQQLAWYKGERQRLASGKPTRNDT